MASIFDTPLLELGQQADRYRQSLWGKDVFYVKNMHLNFTNICTSNCKFCAFRKRKGDPGAYLMSVEQMVAEVKAKGGESTELHIVGGLHPDKDLGYYMDMISTLKSEFPEKTIKAFGAVEMDYISKYTGVPLEQLFTKLKAAGLEMMPGGGAEVFAPRVRGILCPEKISGKEWLAVMEKAHGAGLKTNATMLYGHIETPEEREEHLMAIRALQAKTGGFNAFIPLAFHPDNTSFAHLPKSTAVDDLYVVAAARLILDNVPHIKAYWVMMGEKTAQIALRFGADDLDGTIVKENITYAAGAVSKRGMTEQALIQMITAAGMNPVERDSFYNKMQNKVKR